MTLKDAQKVAEAVRGNVGCIDDLRDLAEDLGEEFPKFEWTVPLEDEHYGSLTVEVKK